MSFSHSRRALPAADLNPHHVRVPLRLYTAAQQAARTAIQFHASETEAEQLQAALAIGSAAEYLARAALANHDPLLLAAHTSAKSLIMLSRANSTGPISPSDLRTIAISEVWTRLGQINTRLTPEVLAATKHVMNVRNAAAHMALVETADLEKAARALVSIIDALHPVGNRDEGDFWPDSLRDSVQLLRLNIATVAQRRAQAKIDLAREHYRSLLQGVMPAERERTQVFLEDRGVHFVARERLRKESAVCPACGRRGTVTYLVEEGEPEHSFDETRGGMFVDYGWSRVLSFSAAVFQCPVCDLQLSPDEFSGVDLDVDLEDETEDIEDPYADWEPDEDYLRGR